MKIKTLLKSLFVLSTALAVFAGVTRATVEVGQPAPDFKLTDIRGKTFRLSELKGKTVVLEWVNPECPFVMKHYESGNIPKLQKTATADGVVWLTINSGRPGAQGDYDPAKAASWMKQMGAASTAYFRDQDGAIGRLYAAKTTPHMYVITPSGTLAYEGAIDSIRSAEKSDIAKATNYVSAALTSVKEGKPVKTTTSQPYGCTVKY
jgi:hypothetical protein